LRLILAADQVWVSTPGLRQRIMSIRPDAEVVTNLHDDRIWITGQAKPPSSDDQIRIVYMGTSTHDQELAFLAPIATQLKAHYGKKISVDIVGVSDQELPHPFQRRNPSGPSAAYSYPGFVEWFTRQSWDIALAPLVENTFNECKSHIKLLDYAALRMPVVASRNEVYSAAFGDGNGVFLVENTTDAWVNLLSSLLDDHETTRSAGERIYQHYIQNHVLTANSTHHLSAINKLVLGNQQYTSSNRKHIQANKLREANLTRELIAAAFLLGQGIEIGALHNPLKIPKQATVQYVDRLDKLGLYKHYPELKQFDLVEVDIIDDGEKLSSIPADSQSFLIANHFLEHTEDPITTLNNLLRVVKPGGILYIAVPDKRHTFDCDRQTTSLSHLLKDYENGPTESREQHYREWVTLVEPHFGRFGPGASEKVISERVSQLMSESYSIHFHCWTSEAFVEFLEYLRCKMCMPFSSEFFGEYPKQKENIVILRKC